jgi:hypothetical protein
MRAVIFLVVSREVKQTVCSSCWLCWAAAVLLADADSTWMCGGRWLDDGQGRGSSCCLGGEG